MNAEKKFLSELLAPELIPEGWIVVDDVAPSDFQVALLVPKPVLLTGEGCWMDESADIILPRARELNGALGLADGKRILAEQDKLGSGFQHQQGVYDIPLLGTKLRDNNDCDPNDPEDEGTLMFGVLHWQRDGHLHLEFYDWKDHRWGDWTRFPCLK
jgi:hypothetical protein